MSEKKIKVTLLKSPFGRLKAHRETVLTLGLRRIRDSVVLPDNQVIRGMVNTVFYLVKVEAV